MKEETFNNISKYIHMISKKYNIDKKNIIKDLLNYIIRSNYNELSSNAAFLDFVENTMHSQNYNNNNVLVNYVLSKVSSFL